MNITILRPPGAVIYIGISNLPSPPQTRRDAETAQSRAVLSALLRDERGITQYTLTKDERGKPSIDRPVGISISHTADTANIYVAAAVAQGGDAIGVDIQALRPCGLTRAARKFCTPDELLLYGGQTDELLRIFTVKEAYSKMTGEGLGMGFSTVNAAELQCRYTRYEWGGIATAVSTVTVSP